MHLYHIATKMQIQKVNFVTWDFFKFNDFDSVTLIIGIQNVKAMTKKFKVSPEKRILNLYLKGFNWIVIFFLDCLMTFLSI